MADKKRVFQIGVGTAIAIVAANMIGTGVFTSLGFQVTDLSPFVILVLWGLGGILALCGAFAYGELGATLPRSGGEYHLLSRIFHPAVGFLAGWVSIIAGFAAPVAAASMAMGKYCSQVLIDTQIIQSSDKETITSLVGLAAVTIVTLVHLFNVKVVSAFQMIFTGLKITLILLLIGFGLFVAQQQAVSFAPGANAMSLILSAPFAVSLVFVMYAYSGWNASVYIAGEIKNPGRNLPLSLFLGTLLVALLYMPINAAFLMVAPVDELAGQVEVGYIAASYIFGPQGGVIMGLLITLGLISAISSMIWAGPRVTQVMGEDTRILAFLSHKNRNGAPSYSLLFQWAIVVFMIFTSTFESVVYYIGFTLSLCSFLTVLGVYVLRIRQPQLPRPYKTWGYPVTPAIYLIVTGWMLFFVLRDKTLESLEGLATVCLGVGFFFLDQWMKRRKGINQVSPEKNAANNTTPESEEQAN